MHDPRSPEVLAWLETLPLAVRLTTLHGMSIGFPQLQRCPEWKARIAKVRDELRPSSRALGDILRIAARYAERLKAELAG
jgi:hypothetical protein